GITGSPSSGSGFSDPGSGQRGSIDATVTGGVTINSVSYVHQTHIILDLNTTAATNGNQNVTIKNPDGQSATGNGILIVGTGVPTPTPGATPTPTPTPAPTGPPVLFHPPPGSTLNSARVTVQWRTERPIADA